MPRSITAIVKPELLVWARESIRLDIEEAAKRQGVETDTLDSWERGAERPTVAQLRKMADVYRRPLAVFYLATPPRDFDAMKYFRRPAGAPERPPSPELTYQIREAETRREVALELALEAEDGPPPKFRARAEPTEDAAEWAARVRAELGVSIDDQLGWRNDYDALAAWRSAVERAGILVFQVSKIPIEEMRGFSIFAEQFPVISVNAADAVRARIFSTMHELGHIVLGQGDVDGSSRFWLSSDRVERFCNSFAGHLLVPELNLSAFTTLRRGERADHVAPSELSSLSARFKVSEQVILLRLLRTNRISETFYKERQAAISAYRPAKSTGGPPYHRRVVASLGRPYVRTVLDAMYRDRITLGDVSDYLGIKLDYLDRIKEAVRLPYEAEEAGAW